MGDEEPAKEPGPSGWSEVEQLDTQERDDSPIAPPTPLSRTVTRHFSPEWDVDIPQTQARPDADVLLELDLNPSDEEVESHMTDGSGANTTTMTEGDQAPLSKKRRANK